MGVARHPLPKASVARMKRSEIRGRPHRKATRIPLRSMRATAPRLAQILTPTKILTPNPTSTVPNTRSIHVLARPYAACTLGRENTKATVVVQASSCTMTMPTTAKRSKRSPDRAQRHPGQPSPQSNPHSVSRHAGDLPIDVAPA